jgi:flagellar assembly protein FliH
MSSRVYSSGVNPEASPLTWRRVLSPEAPAGQTQPAMPDPSERIAELQGKAEQKAREARASGFREGEAAGRARAGADLQAVIERLTRSIEEIAGLRPRLRAEAEADLVRLSLAIARRVLRRELAIDPEALHGLVLAALEKLQRQELTRVRVHPNHAALVAKCLRENSLGAAVEVVPDPAREPGAVVFETQRGNLDASVDSQLQEIERGLADRLRRQA